MTTRNILSNNSSNTAHYGACESTSHETSTPVKASSEKSPSSSKDEWLGTASRPTRRIPNTPFFLSRCDKAVVTDSAPHRENRHGYDMDNPSDAIGKYEHDHPEPFYKKALHFLSDAIFNAVTCCVPAGLSLSAGTHKQRIDQKVVLDIVRQSVDKFPELKIRISEDDFATLDQEDQMRWHEQMSIIRAAQHDFVVNKLAEAYPGHINQNAPTILYTGGRATGYLRVLYCSVDEYLAFYWSDWGLSSTDSGSYRSHVYDYILEGENQNWRAHDFTFNPHNFETTPPGEYTFLGKGDRKIWSFKGPCAMIDHGLGDIPSMAKFAMVSNVTSTLNFSAIGQLLSNQASAVAHEYFQRIKDAFGVTPVSVEPVLRVTEEQLLEAQQYFARIMERV